MIYGIWTLVRKVDINSNVSYAHIINQCFDYSCANLVRSKELIPYLVPWSPTVCIHEVHEISHTFSNFCPERWATKFVFFNNYKKNRTDYESNFESLRRKVKRRLVSSSSFFLQYAYHDSMEHCNQASLQRGLFGLILPYNTILGGKIILIVPKCS